MQRLVSLVRKCADEFDMLQEGDRIAVGLSGGKDSLAMLWALAALKRFHPTKFELEAVTIDAGFAGMDFSAVTAFCESLGVRHTIVHTDIAEIIFDIRKESNPCSLCAKMRRGSLHDTALSLGCKKVALGHHFDDAVETFLMSLFYEGRISCFQPITWLVRKQITVIRPMLYTGEKLLESAVEKLGLPVLKNKCPADGNTKRQEVKELLVALAENYPDIKTKVFGAICRYPLKGWDAGSAVTISADSNL